MRYKFIILFLFISFVSKAQVYQLMPQYGYDTKRMNFDSTIQIPTFCGVPKLGSNKINKGALAFDSCNNRFYFFNPKSQAWDTIRSGTTIDTTKFVRYTDTATMLLPYLRKGDTIFLSQRIDQRVKYTDTSLMLQPYLKAIDTTNKWVNSVVKVNDSTFRVFKGATSTDITLVGNTGIATKLTTTVYNKSGALIPKGSVVYIDGAHSSLYPSIALAKANNEATSAYTYGLVENDISNNSLGIVVQVGSITNLNLPTSSFTDGQTLYLSPTVAGGYTTTKPLAPNHYVAIGTVIRAHPNFGTIQIAIRNGFQLDELSDVQIAAVPTDSTLLQFSRVDSLWHDVSPLTAIGNRYLKPTDSVSLSNRINLKLNISDTSTMLSPYMRTNTANASYVTSVFRKTASDSVFFVRGGSNNFAFRDSTGESATWLRNANNIYYTGGRVGVYVDTPSAKLTVVDNTITTTVADSSGLVLGNYTPATAGVTQRFSPALTFIGQAWGSSGTSNRVNKWRIFNQTLSSGASSSNLIFSNSVNNAAYTDVVTFSSTGISASSINASSVFGTVGLFTTSIRNSGAGSTITIDPNDDKTSGQLNFRGATMVIEAISGTPTVQASSILTLNSTARGFLQPRMTTSQMNAISIPATGLSVFNTTDSLEYVYRGTSSGWQKNVTYTRTNDIGLLNGADQRVMIEPTTNVVAGRALTVEAGSTQAGGTSAFQPLSQTLRNWNGMAAAPNGDIYAAVYNGDIYRRAGGTGNFIALSQTTRNWNQMAAASNGDIYAVTGIGGTGGSSIYKQTGGTGNFVTLGETSRDYNGICIAPNGDIYVCVYNGDIFKQTGGAGAFTALGQTSRQWVSMAAASNGDIYAGVYGGDIYKQTGGTGNFVALGQTSRNWAYMTAASNGDVYAPVYGGDLYKQTNGTGNFIALGQTSRNWNAMLAAPNGDIYANVNPNGDIYLQSQGTANLNGGTLVLQSGIGKGTGTSTISFNTGTTLTSGATLQTASTKMTILGNGNVGIGTTSPSAKLELSDTARGFLQTRMTTTQRNNIASPSVGLQVFTTTDSSQYVYRGTGAGWQQIANEIVNTASLNFPSTNAQNSSDLTITLTGAVDGDAVVLGVPNAAVNANSCYTAWVSAANTVTVRFNNYSSGAIDPASATFRVTIIK